MTYIMKSMLCPLTATPQFTVDNKVLYFLSLFILKAHNVLIPWIYYYVINVDFVKMSDLIAS